jgi:hypothetical protein
MKIEDVPMSKILSGTASESMTATLAATLEPR